MLSSMRNPPCLGRNQVVSKICRSMSTQTPASANTSLSRSYLYVPSSSDRMLEKSLTAGSDVIIYDLEDSVSPAPEDKATARTRLRKFLDTQQERLKPLHVAVRINSISTPFFRDDISSIVSQPIVKSLILPKIHSHYDMDTVSETVSVARKSFDSPPLRLIPSIESARAMFNLGAIASWKSSHGPVAGGVLSALLFAAEDYCADTSVIRTRSRRELLYTRSQIVIAAKAFEMDAIDMVCVDYRDLSTLEDECIDGRQLGFNGKQAIHPSQVGIINSTFVPSPDEIVRAAKILSAMAKAHGSQKGAVGLDGLMIDAPMIRQAQHIMHLARAANLHVPEGI